MIIYKKGGKLKNLFDNQTKGDEKDSFNFKEMVNRVFKSKKPIRKEYLPIKSTHTQHKTATNESPGESVKQFIDVDCSTAPFLKPDHNVGIIKQGDYSNKVESYFINDD